MTEKEIQTYETSGGECPFELWFDDQVPKGQAKILVRVQRVARGNLGDVKSVGEGVHELKFKPKGFPTYRVYFGNDGENLIILLCGGDKTDQQSDISLAKEYWHDYKQRK